MSTGDKWASLVLDAISTVVPGSSGEGTTKIVPANNSIQLLSADNSRKGFILTVALGIIYIGIGFEPSDSQYTYRMTNNCVVEKDGFTGPIYAYTEDGPKSVYITEIK